MKKAIRKIHLWLGLSSGLLVVFLGLTGCILVFEHEIESLASFRHVAVQAGPVQPPSVLRAAAEQSLGNGRKVVSIEYASEGEPALAYYYNETEYFQVYLNPYTGQVLRRKDMSRDFFRFIIEGHYNLWLPHDVGQVIVASATLIFVVMMITGMVLWWPKNKAARKQRFSVKWSAKWRRKNYDLHNVLGFYMTWVAIFIAISGLVMGFQWMAKMTYWLASGGNTMPAYATATSDTLALRNAPAGATTDIAWQRTTALARKDEAVSVTFPATPDAAIQLSINRRPGTLYQQDVYWYDQYTLARLNPPGLFGGAYSKTSVAEKVSRMNYDIHVGAIGGLPTKILAFFASLVATSLPVTGFLIWRGRKKKGSKATPARKGQAAAAVQ